MTVPNTLSPSVVSTTHAYRTLVDDAFTSQFPNWDRVSPFDPVKLVAEGLVGALSAVEARQRRMLESALEAMPSLFGFEPKTARLPVGLFRVRSPERVKLSVMLDGRTSLRMRAGDSTLMLFPVAESQVTPVVVQENHYQGNQLALTLATRSALSELVLTFVPANLSQDRPDARRLSLQVQSGAGTTDSKDLWVVDGTENFRRYGTLRLRRRDGAPLVAEAGPVRITLHADRPLDGALTTNVVAMAYGQRREEISLGCLNGEPWESRALPTDLVGIPERIELRFPDGRRRELRRIADEALRTAADAPARFRESFLYDGVHHRLVLPGADELVGDWNGGVEAFLLEGVCLPETPWIPATAEPALGEASAVLEGLEPEAPLTAAIPREEGKAFLQRFYATMRRLPERATPAPVFVAADLARSVTDAVHELRTAELQVMEDRATAYCLVEDPSSAEAFRLDASVVAQVRRHLEDEVPFRWTLDVRPFERRALAVAAVITVTLSDERLAVLEEKTLRSHVETSFRELLLPPPFGELAASEARSVAELETLLAEKLSSLLEAGELTVVRLTLRDSTGAYVTSVTRPAGQCLEPTLAVTLDRRVRPHLGVVR